MPKNQKEVTLASYNYLLEISAIPAETRKEYLSKLQKRKNISIQKNILLLQIIYSHVDDNKINQWNPKAICKETGISMNALYIHKFRLLKGIREYYFEWKKIDTEIEKKVNKEKDSLKNLIALKLEKARKMVEIGMRREAKNIFLSLENDVKKTFISPAERYLTLTEIYEQLILYYFNKRNKYRLIYCLNKLNNISQASKYLSLSFPKEQMALINIRVNSGRLYLYLLNWSTANFHRRMKFDYPKKIYDLSKKFNNYFYLLEILHCWAVLEIISNNFNRAKELCFEGYNLAKKLGTEAELYTFASMLYHLKTKASEKHIKTDNRHIIEYYNKTKKNAPLNQWTIYLENSLVMTYYPEKKPEILEIFREQVNTNIMLGDYSFAVYWRFILDSELYDDRILSNFNNGINGYLELAKVNENLMEETENLCVNTLCYHKELNDIGSLIWNVYMLQLKSLFFQEEHFDYNKAMLILNKMQWLKKEGRNISSLNTFELLKLSLKMLEHSDSKNYMLSKYEHKLKRTVDNFKKDPSEFDIIDYAILSSLARRLRCKEVTYIVRDLYHWTEKYHPEILRPVLRKIEERESKVHTITGNEVAAA